LPRSSDRTPLLFVYGSLMRGEAAHRLLTGRATFVDDGHVAGTLLDLGRFPGLVDGPGRVWGEVWRLATPEVLRTLDEYEGYNFERWRTTATLAGGRRARVLAYRYRGERARSTVEGATGRVRAPRIIPEGHWRRHRWR
jgi:gamma-glutamylcyclotransferase (GGCT)/AIG2-like uncharacterized protein YtfP